MTVVYDNSVAATRRRTRVLLDSETSLPLIVAEQDVAPIIESNKRIASNFDPIKPRTGSDEWTLVARIPAVMWARHIPAVMWARLTRLGITRDELAFKKWLEHPEAKIARFAEEHGFLDLARSNTRPHVGDVVRIVPNHVCVVVNMMDEVVMVRGEEIVGVLPVAARGKLR